MEIRRIPLTAIVLAPYNPRKDLQPGEPEYEQIKRSIDRWDTVEPLVWNERTGTLVGGHQRLKVLRARGDTEVDVSVVDLPLEEEQALNIALNKVDGAWDAPRLLDLLDNLKESRIEPEVTGFSAADVTAMLRSVSAPLFEPATSPMLSPTLYADEDVERARARLATHGQAPERVLQHQLCPACGHEYETDGV